MPARQSYQYTLSVPSIGSRWLEPPPVPSEPAGCDESFSTLYRVALVGTSDSNPIPAVPTNFQYPLSGRVGWNRSRCGRYTPPSHFQYPLSGRVGWNRIGLAHPPNVVVTFSTLYRVALVGTPLGLQQRGAVQDFQYPLSGRVGWNARIAVMRSEE